MAREGATRITPSWLGDWADGGAIHISKGGEGGQRLSLQNFPGEREAEVAVGLETSRWLKKPVEG